MISYKFNFFLLAFFLFCFQPVLLAKKDTSLVYCDFYWKKTSKKKAYGYMKTYNNADGTFGVQKFYRSGSRVMTGSFTSKDLVIEQGYFTFYNNKGLKEEEGKFENNKRAGTWRTWSESNVSGEGQYFDDKKEGLWIYWKGNIRTEHNYLKGQSHGAFMEWSNDTLTTKGQFENDKKVGEWNIWFRNEQIADSGSYVKGERHGEWKFYFETGELAAIEMYENGKMLKANWWNVDGTEAEVPEITESELSFDGGVTAMMTFIQNIIEYPQISIELGEQGAVYIQFIVEKDGSLTDVKVVMGVSEAIDAEALRVIKAMPKWNPYVDHNRESRVRYTMPIHFRLG